MQIAIPLDKMTTLEKLRAIEDIWDDLCHSKAEIESPSWHAGVLRDRDRLVRSGKAKFMDLDAAKRRLRDRIS